MEEKECAIVFPLLPGKQPAFEAFVRKLTEECRSAHDQSHRTVTHESWFLQSTPQGDLVIVYLVSPDPREVFAELAISEGKFETWFRSQVLDLTGQNLALLPPFCPPTRMLHRIRGASSNAGKF